MPKTIKFNLVLDNASVRNLEDLREHFNIHDLTELHESGLLAKWLSVRGYDTHAAEVNALTAGPGQEVALVQAFVRIFDMPVSEMEMQEAVRAAEFYNLSRRRREMFGEQALELEKVVAGYHAGFDKLITNLHANSSDFSYIKKALSVCWSQYPELFRLHFKEFFFQFFESAPLVVFTTLMHPDMRKLLMGNEAIAKVLANAAGDKKVHAKIPDTVLKRYDQATDSFWKDLVVKGKLVMVIYIPSSTYVRSTGVSGEELAADKVNGHYPLLSGLDYKNNQTGNSIVYMEL